MLDKMLENAGLAAERWSCNEYFLELDARLVVSSDRLRMLGDTGRIFAAGKTEAQRQRALK